MYLHYIKPRIWITWKYICLYIIKESRTQNWFCLIGSTAQCRFLLFTATTRHIWTFPSFLIWGYALLVEHISCVITNYGEHNQHPLGLAGGTSPENILSLYFELSSKILLFQVALLIFSAIPIIACDFLTFGFIIAACISSSVQRIG